jgi:acetylcholinesterase
MTREQYLYGLDTLFQYYPQYRPHYRLDTAAMDAVKFQYSDFLDPNDTDKNLHSLDMAASDSQFICPLNQFAQLYSQAGLDVFAYYFTQRYESNPWPDWMGVLHGDEIFFLFGEPFRYRANYTDDERALSRQMITYWSNFAKTGNPNNSPNPQARSRGPEWPVHSPDGKEYLELNARYLDNKMDDSKAVGRGPRAKECAFWREYLPDLINFTDTDVEIKAREVLALVSPMPHPLANNPTCPPPADSGSTTVCHRHRLLLYSSVFLLNWFASCWHRYWTPLR